MRTLVLSDLHLGYGATAGVFAGTGALPELIAHLADRPLRVVLNGDTFDFSALGEQLESDPESAAQQVRAIADEPANAPVFAALGRVLRGGGALLLRAGEDDRELGLPPVQDGLRRVLGASDRADLVFQSEPGPALLVVGGARIAVIHDLEARSRASAGRSIARRLTGPLRRQFGMEMVDLFKPDAFAGALAALAVNPTAAKLLFSAEPAGRVWPALAGHSSEDPRLAELAAIFGAAELGAHERELLIAALDPEAAIGCDPRDAWLFDQARINLLRAALRRSPVRGAAARPEAWAAALRLARESSAQAVLAGYTHEPCFRSADGLAYVNTGAWVWSLAQTSDETACARLLSTWQRNPRIDARRREPALEASLSAGLIEPQAGGGATLSLAEWVPGHGLAVRASCALAPATT